MAFINSKVSLNVVFPDGSKYRIPKDYIGDIPDKVAKHWLVQAAIKSGHIAVPQGKTDAELESADKKAKSKKK